MRKTKRRWTKKKAKRRLIDEKKPEGGKRGERARPAATEKALGTNAHKQAKIAAAARASKEEIGAGREEKHLRNPREINFETPFHCGDVVKSAAAAVIVWEARANKSMTPSSPLLPLANFSTAVSLKLLQKALRVAILSWQFAIAKVFNVPTKRSCRSYTTAKC